MQPMAFPLLLAVFVASAGGEFVAGDEPPHGIPQVGCKCVPGDKCWPSACSWSALDARLGGKLVKTAPVAQSCYDGPALDLDECAFVTKMWSDQDYQTSHPIGRPYPYNITCAPVDYAAGQEPTTCSLGSSPVYAINATTRADIREGLAFAREHNVRLVVASTGHDLMGRSDGYGSLEIWLRHYRNTIDFQETYASVDGCTASNWYGGAIHIDGAYQWRDVYEIAKANDVIAVGGGAISPGANGGWPSGGGHGPATRNYGLGADQILEAEVMIADGSVVVAGHCANTDLFKALRGGGPGYGIVLSTTIKTHPNVNVVTAHKLAIAPLSQTANNSDLLDAVSLLLRSYPDLNDAGFAGYGFWFRNFPTTFVGNATSGYTHGFWTIGKTQEQADSGFSPVRSALAEFSNRLVIHESFATYHDYWSFYEAESGLYDPTGDTSIITSRMIDRSAVAEADRVREAVEVLSGKPEEYASNVVLLVSGGRVFEDAKDATSGLHPAWRNCSFVIITGRGIPKTASIAERNHVQHDVTFVKGAASKILAPTTGGYMNEGDRNDPEYIDAFYGSQYTHHLSTKQKYDPTGLFYCPTCVGAERFTETPRGALCRT